MADLRAMRPCPAGRKRRHRLTIILPGEDADVTLVCRLCGAVRRFAAQGSLPGERLDDLSADEIAAAVRGAS